MGMVDQKKGWFIVLKPTPDRDCPYRDYHKLTGRMERCHQKDNATGQCRHENCKIKRSRFG